MSIAEPFCEIYKPSVSADDRQTEAEGEFNLVL